MNYGVRVLPEYPIEATRPPGPPATQSASVLPTALNVSMRKYEETPFGPVFAKLTVMLEAGTALSAEQHDLRFPAILQKIYDLTNWYLDFYRNYL